MADAQMSKAQVIDLRVYFFSDPDNPETNSKPTRFELAPITGSDLKRFEQGLVQCNCACK